MNLQTVRVKALVIENQLRMIKLSCVYSIAHREHLFTKTVLKLWTLCVLSPPSLRPSLLPIPLNVKLPEKCIGRVCYF